MSKHVHEFEAFVLTNDLRTEWLDIVEVAGEDTVVYVESFEDAAVLDLEEAMKYATKTGLIPVPIHVSLTKTLITH